MGQAQFADQVAEVLPPWETVVDLSLTSTATGTRVALSQGPFLTEERLALHRDGWSDSFEKLVLAARSEG